MLGQLKGLTDHQQLHTGDKHKTVKQSSFQVCPEEKHLYFHVHFFFFFFFLVCHVLARKLLGEKERERERETHTHTDRDRELELFTQHLVLLVKRERRLTVIKT